MECSGLTRKTKEDLAMKKPEEILDNLYDALYFVDRQRHITFWNKAAEQLTGYTSTEVLGKSCGDDVLKHIDAQGNLLCQNNCPVIKCMEDGQNLETDVFVHHKDGHVIPVSLRISPIRDDSGTVIGAIELFNDRSPKIAMMERMKECEELALMDSLTRLANRRYVEISIEKRINELRRYGWTSGILFLDIDHFKNINDNHGHDIGDEVLKAVVNTLVSNCRPFDVFGRWGGEEFVGIIRNVDGRNLYNLANKLRILVENTLVKTETDVLQVTVSVGATLLSADDTIESVIKRADQLMYESKKEGRNKVTTDSPDAH